MHEAVECPPIPDPTLRVGVLIGGPRAQASVRYARWAGYPC
jgi:hypothetical protein